MPNMAYCRFRNTLRDLWDCADALDDMDGDLSELSDDERRAAKALIRLAQQIAQWEDTPDAD